MLELRPKCLELEVQHGLPELVHLTMLHRHKHQQPFPQEDSEAVPSIAIVRTWAFVLAELPLQWALLEVSWKQAPWAQVAI